MSQILVTYVNFQFVFFKIYFSYTIDQFTIPRGMRCLRWINISLTLPYFLAQAINKFACIVFNSMLDLKSYADPFK